MSRAKAYRHVLVTLPVAFAVGLALPTALSGRVAVPASGLEAVAALDGLESGPAVTGWKIPFDGSGSRPVVADGKVFVGSADGTMSAFDAATGRRIWRFQTGKGLPRGVRIIVTKARTFGEMLAESQKERGRNGKGSGRREIVVEPLVDRGTVFIGSRDHFYYALDTEDGKPRWAVDTGGEVLRQALLYRDLLVIPTSSGFIEAVDTGSGEERWSFETLTGISRKRSPNQPVLQEGLLYVTSWPFSGSPDQSFLQAINAASGELEWELAFEGGHVTRPIVVGGLVFVANCRPSVTLYAVDSATGSLTWEYTPEASSAFPFDLLSMANLVFLQFNAVTRPLTYTLVALDQATGEIRWRRTGRHRNLVVGDLLYLSGDRIEALDPSTGVAEWSREDKRRIWGVVNGDLLVSFEGDLSAIDSATGAERWRMDTGSGLSALPTRSGARLFIPTSTETYFGLPPEQGHLFAIDAAAGPVEASPRDEAAAVEPAVAPSAPIDEDRLAKAIHEGAERVVPANQVHVSYDRQAREVLVQLTLPSDGWVHPADPLGRWRENQRAVYKQFRKRKIPVEWVVVEITLAGGGAIRMSHPAKDVQASFLDWLRLGKLEKRDRGSAEWTSSRDKGGH